MQAPDQFGVARCVWGEPRASDGRQRSSAVIVAVRCRPSKTGQAEEEGVTPDT
jgi:hypothetical protein